MNTTRILIALLAIVVLTCQLAIAQSRDPYAAARRKMVDSAVIAAGVKNERVIESIRQTQRHQFVPRNEWPKAYYDMALPIGEKQTISSPFIVAYMTESLDPQPDDRVLEIGTGSGYQAAVLSPLVKDVYTIEIVPELGRAAMRTLRRLDYDNVHVKIGDGFKGWPEHAPFDKIIVTCSPEKVPLPLVQQLREGGRIVVPVGERYQQVLYLLTKRNGELVAEALRPTLFVPMTGRAEDNRRVKPDGANPKIVNGSFEEDPGDSEHAPGWYYQRQQYLEEDPKAPHGDRVLTFRNRDVGRVTHGMQGFPIDGRKVTSLELSAWSKSQDVVWGEQPDAKPMVVLTLYDKDHKDLGSWWLGPWHGDNVWHKKELKVRVPPTAYEGIVRIGLFGAIGEVSFDDIRLIAHGPGK